jgi:hypothetical protein
MQELSMHLMAGTDNASATIRIELQTDGQAVSMTAEGPFNFRLQHDEGEELRWYLEDYASCPWGAYQERAARAEASIEKIGTRLFRAAFNTEAQKAIYSTIADDLRNLSVAIVD